MKKLLALVIVSLVLAAAASAQAAADYFALGYNDAAAGKPVDSRFKVDSLKAVMGKLTLSEMEDYSSNAADYNRGYINGLTKILKQNVELDWNSSIGALQASTKDGNIVTIEAQLAFQKDDPAATEAMKSKAMEIKGYIRRFCTTKDSGELKNNANLSALAEQLKDGLNTNVFKSKIVQDIMIKQIL